MLVAVEYVGSVGCGVTRPQYFKASNGNVYVVKLQNNRLGTKVLANEYLAAQMGYLLNLRFPPSDIIEISEEYVSLQPDLAELGISAGRHFASLYLDNTEYLSKFNIRQAANIPEMAGVILFDHLFHNSDRAYNRRNLLLRQENDEFIIYAIDNSHLLRSGTWTVKALEKMATRKRVYYRYNYGILLRECLFTHDFLPFAERVRSLSDSIIDQAVDEIPVEWLPDQNERKAMAQYIKLRCSMLDEMLRKLYRQIPEERGGKRMVFRKRESELQKP